VLAELRPGDPERLGPYRLMGRLGSGGMGRVFLARSPGGRLVAVKMIHAELADIPDFRERFARELAAARRVSGLFTAPVVDADMDAPDPWLATAYVSGPSLGDEIASHGPLPVESVFDLAAGLAEGLAAIHAAGVIHRDLKPSNVLLAEDGPRVIDFGISRAAEISALTGTGLVVGSPGFMSPEQAEGGEVGTATDVFSLGSVLAFAATGKGPYGSGSAAALVYRVVHGDPDLDDLSAELRPLVQRCLAKDPVLRPSTGLILSELETLRPVQPGLPVQPGAGDSSGPATVTSVKTPDRPRTSPAPEPSAGPPTEPGQARGRPRRARRNAAIAVAAAVTVAAATVVIVLISTSPPAPKAASDAASLTAYVGTSLAQGGGFTGGNVTPVNIATGTPGAPINIGQPVLAVAVAPGRHTVYAVTFTDPGRVIPISAATEHVGEASLVGPGANGIAITPDGQFAYVTSGEHDTVTPVNLATGVPEPAIPVGGSPNAIAMAPDGETAYVAEYGQGTVVPINLATDTAGSPIQLGAEPFGIAITPNGETAYVTNRDAGDVTPINLATDRLGLPIVIGGADVTGIVITPDGKTAYVSSCGTNAVVPINLAHDSAGRPIPVSGCPGAIAIAPNGKTAYVATKDGVTPLDLAKGVAGPAIPVANVQTIVIAGR
jgi:YVTN family beta-propeller protein